MLCSVLKALASDLGCCFFFFVGYYVAANFSALDLSVCVVCYHMTFSKPNQNKAASKNSVESQPTIVGLSVRVLFSASNLPENSVALLLRISEVSVMACEKNQRAINQDICPGQVKTGSRW